MTAKEMFEELGYIEIFRDKRYSMNSIKIYTNGINQIYFNFNKQIYAVLGIFNMKLLQAINKQVEELWGDNNE